MKALVVEDDAATNELFVEALGDGGFTVEAAADAEAAIAKYRPDAYALITLDLNLPGMDGLEFCRWLRSQPQGEDPYVIAITGRAEPEDLQEVLKAGIDDYIAKPVTLEKFFVRLAMAQAAFARQEKYRQARAELTAAKKLLREHQAKAGV
ncbi:MAG: response regulator transcription factor [Verrucomicrobiota bacterium]